MNKLHIKLMKMMMMNKINYLNDNQYIFIYKAKISITANKITITYNEKLSTDIFLFIILIVISVFLSLDLSSIFYLLNNNKHVN